MASNDNLPTALYILRDEVGVEPQVRIGLVKAVRVKHSSEPSGVCDRIDGRVMRSNMERYWLITWTCYGTWLPGAQQGFVSHVRDDHGNLVIHNIPGTPYDADMPALEAHARGQMKGPPVSGDHAAAEAMIAQYQETCRIRGWELEGPSVMYNHTHVVVGVSGDPKPASIRETFKSWATRALKKLRPLPPNGTFWTAKSSNRKLPDDRAVRDGVIYVVRKQPNSLVVWYHPNWQTAFDEYDQAIRLASRLASRTP